MCVRVFFFFVLCCPTKSRNRFISFRNQILNLKRLEGLIRTYFTSYMFTVNFMLSSLIKCETACRKRRLKWVATLPLGDINTEAWSSGMGVGRGLTTLPCKK
jgi:hypothetical protein